MARIILDGAVDARLNHGARSGELINAATHASTAIQFPGQAIASARARKRETVGAISREGEERGTTCHVIDAASVTYPRRGGEWW